MNYLIGALVIIALTAIYFVLQSEHAVLTHPKGIIAHRELKLMITNVLLMLVIIVPTFILLFWVVCKYRSSNAKNKDEPDESSGIFDQTLLWLGPSIVVAVMSVITWDAAHELDPSQTIKSDVAPLTVQVVAMDWKWLFIYPEQGIATVNFVQLPEHTPINFKLAADNSPMNSFWIPQLSGQIYAMSGMITQLHIMAEPGVYTGKAAEINGAGYADMTFKVNVTARQSFDDWVKNVQQSPLQLNDSAYAELLERSIKHPIALYSNVEKELFNKIVMKYMHPHE